MFLSGVVMISCALVCDAVIGNVQEKSMKTYKASNTEVVLYSYSIGFVYLLLAMVLTNTVWAGISFCARVSFFKYYRLKSFVGLNTLYNFLIS